LEKDLDEPIGPDQPQYYQQLAGGQEQSAYHSDVLSANAESLWFVALFMYSILAFSLVGSLWFVALFYALPIGLRYTT
jgi:hypothetical protein